MTCSQHRIAVWAKSWTVGLATVVFAFSTVGCGESAAPPKAAPAAAAEVPAAKGKAGKKLTAKQEDSVLSGREKKALREGAAGETK